METYRANSVESMANYEGNDALLLFERIKDPVIREQILSLLVLGEESAKGKMIILCDDNGRLLKDEWGNLSEVPYVPLSKEAIENRLGEAIEREERETRVEWSKEPYKSSDSHEMQMKSIAPWNDKPFSEKQMSIIEAHEKGHNFRTYDEPYFEEYFLSGFRYNTQLLKDEDVTMFRKTLSEEDQNSTDDEVKDMVIHYITRPVEITERMSQLKNYFGMKGNEEFTREHLVHAREHYVKDTGMDNGINIFFRAITPDTEDEFLRLINCSGI